MNSLSYKYILAIGIVVIFGLWLFFDSNSQKEHFIFNNIRPTEHIDPEYRNINQDPWNYFNHKRVGDIHGVDLNCNNVHMYDLLKWIDQDDPHILPEYVYKYDPSISVFNPIHAPRVFKMLLRNLPQKHKYIPILRKCLYKGVRIA